MEILGLIHSLAVPENVIFFNNVFVWGGGGDMGCMGDLLFIFYHSVVHHELAYQLQFHVFLFLLTFLVSAVIVIFTI